MIAVLRCALGLQLGSCLCFSVLVCCELRWVGLCVALGVVGVACGACGCCVECSLFTTAYCGF